MYNKNSGLNGQRETREVELTVADDELKAALTTGGLIGTTGGILTRRCPYLPYLDWFKRLKIISGAYIYWLIFHRCRVSLLVKPDEACFRVFVPSHIRLKQRDGQVWGWDWTMLLLVCVVMPFFALV